MPVNAVVIVEGMFLHRDELADRWDWSVFLDVPFTETARRMAERDGGHPDPEHPSMRRYVEGQRIYFAACRSRERATVVMDSTHPVPSWAPHRPTTIARDCRGACGAARVLPPPYAG